MISFLRTKRRCNKFGSQYFDSQILPKCHEILKEIEMASHPDASDMFRAFVKMDIDGDGRISCVEFHRYFELKRGVFTERIFDSYASHHIGSESIIIESKEDQSFEEFLVCLWNYCSYDASLMARYVFNIFDVDQRGELSMDECYAMLRMVFNNQQENLCDSAIKTLRDYNQSEFITLDSFLELVETNNDIIKPAFDYQSRFIERISGSHHNQWECYRQARRRKFGSSGFVDIKYSDRHIQFTNTSSNGSSTEQLNEDFLSALFRRFECLEAAPEGFDSRLPEERYADKILHTLKETETLLSYSDFPLERLEERKELRSNLWRLLEELKAAHLDALEAERERDRGMSDRCNVTALTTSEQTSDPRLSHTTDEVNQRFEVLVENFRANWVKFFKNYEERFGSASCGWEKLYDPDLNLSYYFQWRTGQRCYNQQNGSQLPAVCEICDSLIDLTDYKCFNCDAPRSDLNKRKYRGRIPIEDTLVRDR